MTLQPGVTILDKYRIVRLLGEGGMARVWLAEELTASRRRVAIKEPKGDDLQHRFEHEISLTAELIKAPHVVSAFTVEPFNGIWLLVMNYMPGGSLKDLLSQPEHKAGLPIERVIAIALDVLGALEALHRLPNQPVHRDVKPSNILFDKEGRVYLADFGLAQLPGISDDRTRLAAGAHPATDVYAAPEQLGSSASLSPAADLFALGCVLWEMLTGQRYKRSKPGTPPSQLRRDVPAWLNKAVMKALAENAWDRWRSADEMTRAIQVGQQKEFQRAEKIKRRQQAKAQGLVLVRRLLNIERSVDRQLRLAQNRWRQLTLTLRDILRRSWSTFMQGTRVAKPSRSWLMLVPFVGLLLVAISMVLTGTPDPKVPNQAMPKTEMEVMNVPAGEFVMGSRSGYGLSPDESPQRTVYVSSFSIDKTEVTVAQYRRCVEDEACSAPVAAAGCNYQVEGKSDHPINCVTWHQARTYCLWVNKRLPSEAEWEKAARGTDARVYPWGNDWDAAKVNSTESGISATVAVGVFQSGASPYGALDMAGNVWEWTEDWYNASYYEQSPVENPRGPDTGETRALRGGAWQNPKEAVTVTRRVGLSPDGAFTYAGFRCAHSP